MSNIAMNKTILNKKFETKIGADIIVPDTKGDVANVIAAYATISVGESYVSKDKITVSGNICYSIIYKTDEENPKVSPIKYKTPFSHQIDITDADKATSVCVKANVLNVDFSMLNSRKIGVSANILFDVFLAEYIEEEITVLCDEGLPVKTDRITVFSSVISQKEEFDTEYKTNLSDAKSIIQCFAKIISKDVKVINNKVILKGCVNIGIVYENSSCEIAFFECNSEFTEVFEANNILPEMITNVDLKIKETEAMLDVNEEETVFNVWVGLCAFINSYDEYEYDIFCDAYSPEYEIDAQTKQLSYIKLIKSISDKIYISDYIDIAKSFVNNILDITVLPKITKQNAVDSKINIEGNVAVNILYLSYDNEVECVRKSIPFSYSYDIKCNTDLINVSCDVALADISQINNGEIKISLELNMLITENNDAKIITSIKLDKAKAIDKKSMPGITIYFVQSGDTLWEIAKKYHTTVDKISSVNNLDKNKNLNIGERLLIPKK